MNPLEEIGDAIAEVAIDTLDALDDLFGGFFD